MRKTDVHSSSPGRLIEIQVGNERLEGFLPDHLPPELSLSMQSVQSLTRAENLLGRLDGMTEALPDPSILIRAFIRREAAVSSYIEDTFAAYEDIGLTERNREPMARSVQSREVLNAERVIGYSIQAIREQHRKVTPTLLKEMHRLLFTGTDVSAAVVGDYRQKQVFIGKRLLGHQQARFVPPPNAFVPELVEQLCQYLDGPSTFPALVSNAIAHYQFETIHPFEDGNGRLGRALILVKLCQDHCLRLPVLNPSLYFESHRDEYYDALLAVSQSGKWNSWVDFFVRGIIHAAQDAIERVQAIRKLMEKYRSDLHRAQTSVLLLRLVDQLFVYPRITISMAAEIMGITKEAARKHVERLIKAGVLEEVTGQPTNRIFVARKILESVRVTPTSTPPDERQR